MKVNGNFATTVKLSKQDVPVYVEYSGDYSGGNFEEDEITVTLGAARYNSVGCVQYAGDTPIVDEIELWDALDAAEQDKILTAMDVDAAACVEDVGVPV